jgi:hypothetical protein
MEAYRIFSQRHRQTVRSHQVKAVLSGAAAFIL